MSTISNVQFSRAQQIALNIVHLISNTLRHGKRLKCTTYLAGGIPLVFQCQNARRSTSNRYFSCIFVENCGKNIKYANCSTAILCKSNSNPFHYCPVRLGECIRACAIQQSSDVIPERLHFLHENI